MVSFSCEGCGDVMTKKKLDAHRNRCHAAFSCLDCSVTFHGTDYRSHTSCISEAQKYEKTVWKGDKKNKKQQNQQPNKQEETTMDDSQALVPVSVFAYQEVEIPDNRVAVVDAPPRAPSPPPMVNVFDYMLGDGMTTRAPSPPTFGMNGYDYQTPASGHSRNVSTDSATKRSGKRKRTSVEDIDVAESRRYPPNGDVIMTDVPAVHSGLTGGIHRMLRPEFPPSPDYSGGDAPATSPASPLKRSKKDKEASKSKDKKPSEKSKEKKEKKDKERSPKKSKLEPKSGQWVQIRKRSSTGRSDDKSESKRSQKAIEGKPESNATDGALIVHPDRMAAGISARAELFMSFVTHGPEHDKGCSINKALKRYHRERGDRVSKLTEEKELWKSLRLRINDRGEIVLFPGPMESS